MLTKYCEGLKLSSLAVMDQAVDDHAVLFSHAHIQQDWQCMQDNLHMAMTSAKCQNRGKGKH